MMTVEEGGRKTILRFSTRRAGGRDRPAEVVHFYGPAGGKVFHARCERGVVSSFLERANGRAERSRTGRTLYLGGGRGEELFRKLIILAGCRQCVRSPSKALEVAEAVLDLGVFETIFWYNKMVEEYERESTLGVCRVARAFRILYGID